MVCTQLEYFSLKKFEALEMKEKEKRLAHSSPPEGREEKEEVSTATCQNTL